MWAKMHLSLAILIIFTIFSCKNTVKTSSLRSSGGSSTSMIPAASKSPEEDVALIAYFDWPSQSLIFSAHKPLPSKSFKDQIAHELKVDDKACGSDPLDLPFSPIALEKLAFNQTSYSKLQFRGFGQGAADLHSLSEKILQVTFGMLQENLTWQWVLSRSQAEASTFVVPTPPKFENVTLKFGTESIDLEISDLSRISDIYQTPTDKKFELTWSSTGSEKSYVFIFMKDRKGGKKQTKRT